jgi:hypothetical protein
VFCINNYSSVSTVIERTKQKAIADRKLKLPVAPMNGISATLQQAHGESSKCKEVFFIVIRSLSPAL